MHKNRPYLSQETSKDKDKGYRDHWIRVYRNHGYGYIGTMGYMDQWIRVYRDPGYMGTLGYRNHGI